MADEKYRIIAEQGDLGLYDEILSEKDQQKVREETERENENEK